MAPTPSSERLVCHADARTCKYELAAGLETPANTSIVLEALCITAEWKARLSGRVPPLVATWTQPGDAPDADVRNWLWRAFWQRM